jgi:hypothetical protein
MHSRIAISIRALLVAVAYAGLVAPLAIANAPPAQALPSNCQAQPWGFLGSQTRQICDSRMGADGAWMEILSRPVDEVVSGDLRFG